jgi:hypothetical protein
MKIACDVDDVLGAFYSTLCRKHNMPEVQVDIWDGKVACSWIDSMFPELYEKLDFWSEIEILSNPGSITFEIDHYITSIPPHLHSIREKWLSDNGFPARPLICSLGSKVETMKSLGINVLIDDKPSTIKAVREAGMIGIQFVPSYMSDYDKNDLFTITHLSQVNKILNI